MTTLLSLLQDVCDFGGFPRPTSIINSSDATARQLLAIANERGAEATRMFDWPQLTKLSSITLSAGTTQTLPTDCAELLDSTAWYTGDITPLRGPITPQEWQRLTQTGVAGLKFAFRVTQNSAKARAVAMTPTPVGNEVISLFYRSKTWIKPREYVSGMTVTAGSWCFSDGEYWTANTGGTAGSIAPTIANLGATSPIAWTRQVNALYERFTADTDEPLIEPSILMKGILARFYRMKGLDYQDLEAEFYSGLRNDLAERNGGRTENLFRGSCGFLDTVCADVGFIGGVSTTPTPVEPTTPTYGAIWGWGGGTSGSPYWGAYAVLPSVVGVPSPAYAGDWKSISLGDNVATGIKNDGTMWAWGFGGALGKPGGASNTTVPVEVISGTTWTKVAAGYYWAIAIKSDGTLWEWGSSNFGRSDLNNLAPRQIGSNTDWVDIKMRGRSSFGKRSNGKWYAWNYGENGELGLISNPGSTFLLTPVEVPFSSSWDIVYAGIRTTLVIKTDGTLWGTGLNNRYQLGTGNTTSSNQLVQIADGEWVSCSNGLSISHAVKADGTLWAWGQNHAALGNGVNNSGIYVTTPTQIGTATDWKAVYSSTYLSNGFFDNDNLQHTLFQKQDNTLWACGYNTTANGSKPQGILGTGNGTIATVPTKISDAKDWVDISLGFQNGMVIVGA